MDRLDLDLPRPEPGDPDHETQSLRPTISIPPPPVDSRKPRRASPVQLIAAIVVFGLVVVAFAIPERSMERVSAALIPERFKSAKPKPAATAAPKPKPEPAAAPEPAGPRADEKLDRSFRTAIHGATALLYVLPSFESADGQFNLALHLHGNTDLVAQTYEYSKLNAVLLIMNIGRFSGKYEDTMMVQGAVLELMDRAEEVMKGRGLKNAKVRRVAISSWSGGYGGVIRAIEQPKQWERIDALVMIDGIHVGYKPREPGHPPRELEPVRLKLFTDWAKLAVEGKKLMSITHSEIVPVGFASCHETTDAMLEALGIERQPGGTVAPMPPLPELANVMPKANLVPLEPLSETRKGAFIMRGYAGDQAVTHMLALAQMSTTGLPELVKWWSKDKTPEKTEQ